MTKILWRPLHRVWCQMILLEQIKNGESSSRRAGKEGEAREGAVIALILSIFGFTTDSDESCQKIKDQEEIKRSSLQEEVTRSSVLDGGTNCPNDKDQLPSLLELNEIWDALKDPELQKMVLQIDDSSESEKELEKLMEGQAFQQFTIPIRFLTLLVHSRE